MKRIIYFDIVAEGKGGFYDNKKIKSPSPFEIITILEQLNCNYLVKRFKKQYKIDLLKSKKENNV